MIIDNISLQNMYLNILMSLDKRTIAYNANTKIAISDTDYIVLYVSYKLEEGSDTEEQIIVLEPVFEGEHSFIIKERIIIDKNTIITGLDITSDGKTIAVGCINIYRFIPNEEYIRVISFVDNEHKLYDLYTETNNVHFGHNVLFTEEDKLLLVSSPLGNNDKGNYHIYGLNKKKVYEEVDYQKKYFDKLFDRGSYSSKMFGYDASHLEHLSNFIHFDHIVDDSGDIIKLLPK